MADRPEASPRGLSPAKRALLERWRRGQAGAEATAQARIPRRPSGEALVLSFAQQRLWFLDQLEVANPAYNIPLGVGLAGALDVRALARALGGVRRRHEVLRTLFPSRGGRPAPRVRAPRPAALPVVDLGALPRSRRQPLARRLAAAEAGRPFDLTRGPVLRACLLRLAPDDHALVLTLHHIVADAWSLAILTRELSALYRAAVTGTAAELPELPIQYADYAHWQRRRLTGQALDDELAYWRRRLEGGTPVLALPADRPRPALQSFRGGRHAFALDDALSRRVRGLVRSERTTLFAALLTAFQALLARVSGQRSFNLGSPVSGRSRAELEPLVGCFVNTLVLDADLSGDPSYRYLLRRVHQSATGAFAHRELPFERLVAELADERDLSRNPLFQVLFALQKVEPPPLALPGLETRVLAVDPGAAQLDLTLNLVEEGESVRGWLEYNRDLFDATTAARLAQRLQRLLAAAVAAPEAPLSSLPALAPAEAHQLTVEWNDTAAELPEPPSVPHLFAARAAAVPEATALICGGDTLSYGELARRVRELAAALRRHGVGPEVVVGVSTERSPALPVALLGVMAAGGAYLPLDPTYPPERLAYVLADARVAGRVTDGSLEGRAEGAGGPGFHLCLEASGRLEASGQLAEDVLPAGPPAAVEAAPPAPANAAYVIYTSGSTGEPKGIQIVHRALASFLTAMSRRPGLGAGDLLVAVTTLSFDIAALELYLPLLVGARLLLARREEATDGSALAGLLSRHRATALQATPATWRLLLAAGWAGSPRLAVLCGGEALGPELAAELMARGGSLWNLYGPTETTVWSAVARVGPEVAAGAGAVPVGRPILNTDAHLLDRSFRPVPLGTAGELTLGGVGLARGYLGRPGQTAERFVPHPAGRVPGQRLYRTGDLARRRADGELEFLGRLDFQVKVRGFRIEPGEIEAALERHPAVRQAVVVARADGPRAGERRLVAYLVPAGDGAPAVEELRRHLAARLPDSMQPAVLVTLDALPLTPNGKVDRKALPAPSGERPVLERRYVAPGTPAEVALAEIWSRVLGIDRVGVEDNFFELGGDSISSLEVVSAAADAGLELQPRDLFAHQTLAALAAAAGALTGVPLTGPGAAEAIPLTPAQHGWLEGEGPLRPAGREAVLEVEGDLPGAVLEEALGHLLARHDALRLAFRSEEGGGPAWGRQEVVAAGHPVPCHYLDLSRLAAPRRQPTLERAVAALAAGLDPARGPLLRVALCRCGPEEPDRLLLACHPLAADKASAYLLLEELSSACAHLRRDGAGEPAGPDADAPPTPFARWAAALARDAASPVPAEEAESWRRQPWDRAPRLPAESPARADSGDGGEVPVPATVTLALGAEESRDLFHQAPAAYNLQVDDLLLTALVEAFAPWTGARRLLIELESDSRLRLAGGEEMDLSRTVGPIAVRYPVLLDLEAAGEPGDALKAVKEQLRQVPRGGIGHGLLRWGGGGAASEGETAPPPRPQVAFSGFGQRGEGPAGTWLAPVSGWTLTAESSGGTRVPSDSSHSMEIDAAVAGGRLVLSWTYDPARHRRQTVEELADRHLATLSSLIAHCASPEASGFTPSDFPEARMSQEDLDRILGAMKP